MFKKDYALIYDELACLNNLKKKWKYVFTVVMYIGSIISSLYLASWSRIMVDY